MQKRHGARLERAGYMRTIITYYCVSDVRGDINTETIWVPSFEDQERSEKQKLEQKIAEQRRQAEEETKKQAEELRKVETRRRANEQRMAKMEAKRQAAAEEYAREEARRKEKELREQERQRQRDAKQKQSDEEVNKARALEAEKIEARHQAAMQDTKIVPREKRTCESNAKVQANVPQQATARKTVLKKKEEPIQKETNTATIKIIQRLKPTQSQSKKNSRRKSNHQQNQKSKKK